MSDGDGPSASGCGRLAAHCKLVTGGAAADAESEPSRPAGWTLCVLWQRAPRDGSPEQRPVLLEKVRTRVAWPGGRTQPLEAQLEKPRPRPGSGRFPGSEHAVFVGAPFQAAGRTGSARTTWRRIAIVRSLSSRSGGRACPGRVTWQQLVKTPPEDSPTCPLAVLVVRRISGRESASRGNKPGRGHGRDVSRPGS